MGYSGGIFVQYSFTHKMTVSLLESWKTSGRTARATKQRSTRALGVGWQGAHGGYSPAMAGGRWVEAGPPRVLSSKQLFTFTTSLVVRCLALVS